jgi:hypothetical protein
VLEDLTLKTPLSFHVWNSSNFFDEACPKISDTNDCLLCIWYLLSYVFLSRQIISSLHIGMTKMLVVSIKVRPVLTHFVFSNSMTQHYSSFTLLSVILLEHRRNFILCNCCVYFLYTKIIDLIWMNIFFFLSEVRCIKVNLLIYLCY